MVSTMILTMIIMTGCTADPTVRLVNGTSSCSGRVEVFNKSEWKRVCDNQWDMKDAKVVCRQLGCGSVVAVPYRAGEERGATSISNLKCSGKESTLDECFTYGYGDAFYQCFDASVVCSAFVRLLGGTTPCSGRVEVKSNQSWTSVCEADFDQPDAEVVCRELGCGAPAAIQGGLYGEGQHPIWAKEFQCKGDESLLLDCDTLARNMNSCTKGSNVGLTCIGRFLTNVSNTFRLFSIRGNAYYSLFLALSLCISQDRMRLVQGGSRCAGKVQMYLFGDWVTLMDTEWDIAQAAVVCRQLACGSAISAPGGALFGNGTGQVVRGSIPCNGSEQSLFECQPTFTSPTRSCCNDAGVICSDLLSKPEIFLTDTKGGVSRGHSFTITCSTQPQYPGGSFLLTLIGSNRTHIQPAVNHSAVFLFPAADDSHQGKYSCVYEMYVFSHNFTSESVPLYITVKDSFLTTTSSRRDIIVLLVFMIIPMYLLVHLYSVNGCIHLPCTKAQNHQEEREQLGECEQVELLETGV
ncbi:scavenger receptor cysteine-rich domain-containing group B protein isoform X2 [Esox lucius]|uniref:scavenger receptor cysteine-rich domain-containing group B protein isoform X2 n=1 Tax=Esox lucius TaxID=8010 RepID=UPI0014772912|nr:scavenger receptor cysteine-rich domain-containing group B protein isoform X2 [Esox lucius]